MERLFGRMDIKKLAFCLLIVLLHTLTFSQVKLSPQLEKNRDDLANSRLTVSVKYVDNFRSRYLNKLVIHQIHSTSGIITISDCDNELLKDLERDNNVLFVDRHEKVRAEATLDHVNSNFNRISRAHFLFPSTMGNNQRISIKEASFDTTDIDLKNRIFSTGVTPSTTSQHATNMATLIAGGGNSSWRALGVAPLSHFTASDFSILTPDDISIFNSQNIHLQNHSYGVGIENYYGAEAFAYDQQVFQNPTLLHVFSSGNSGQLQPTSGTYQNLTFANLTGNFKQAKNVLVVNAVDTTLTINSLNSRGPAFDGRVKPELTAFGQSGTSEAAALGSGISALVQEKYFESKNQWLLASAVKAILIASSDDIGPTGVDYLYGYGSINASRALQLIDSNRIANVSITPNSQNSIPINIPASTADIKIAVVWTDPPAAVNASSVLVNDIDSWLDDGTSITLPWVLNPYPKSDSLLSSAKRKQDHINNVEFITLSNPPQGLYQLVLKSGNLAGSSQNVSVAYWTSSANQFSWDYPDSTQIVEGGSKSLLTWEALSGQTGDLYQQLNQGSWQLVKSGINLNYYFYWQAPDSLVQAKLKMVIGSSEFLSEQFLISPMLQTTTAFNCADSLGLVWNSLKGASGYEIYTMDTQYLKKISTAADSLKILPKSADLFYAVAPVLNGVVGLKSETIDYTQQGAFCFLDFFSADRSSASQINVQLTLSSWYGVDHVIIYKTTNETLSSFKNLSSSTILDFTFTDVNLTPGTLIYQAEIFFRNGSTLFSDVISIQIEEKGKAIIYPNPVSSEDDLHIISEGDVGFRVMDVFGRIVFEKKLELFEDAIDTERFPSGLYVYQILSGDHVSDTGRFVKY